MSMNPVSATLWDHLAVHGNGSIDYFSNDCKKCSHLGLMEPDNFRMLATTDEKGECQSKQSTVD